MDRIEYQGATPVVAKNAEGDWQVVWERTAEAAIAADYLAKQQGRTALVRLRNASSRDLSRIESGVEDQLGRRVLNPRLYSGSDYFWCYLVGLCADRGVAMTTLLGEMIKYSANANAVVYSRSDTVRHMASTARRIAKEGHSVTLSKLVSDFGLVLAHEEFSDYKITKDIQAVRLSSAGYFDAFLYDYEKNEDVRRILSESVYSLDGTAWPIYSDLFVNHMQKTENLHVICTDPRYSRIESQSTHEINGIVQTIHLSLLTLDELRSVVRPVWISTGADFIEDVFGRLIGRRRSRPDPALGGKEFGEAATTNAVHSVINLLAEPSADLRDADIAPKPALVDAAVHDGRLRLAGTDQTGSETDEGDLEALRKMHLSDVERLQTQLAGSNAGPGLSHRLGVLRDALSTPLSSASSLIVATQVRALEDMMPSVGAMLADVTAADVGATVTGVGLYARQFPAWNKFIKVAEAEITPALLDLEAGLHRAIKELGTNLDHQPDSLVSRELKAALATVGEAADSTSDKVIEFGRVRGIGNAYRAIARYLKERRDGSVSKFNEEIDSVVGKQAAKVALAGVMVAAAGPLLSLAAAAPSEFGWFLGVYAMLNLKGES